MKSFFSRATLLAGLLMVLSACAPEGTEPGPAEVAQAAPADSCTLAPADPQMACTMEYKPVCGCDDKTYPNACAARAAGVPESTPGTCDEGLD